MNRKHLLCGLAAAAVAFACAEARASKGTLRGTPDALLILGCRVRGSDPEPTLRLRAEAAAAYLNAHPDVLAVPCGGIVHDDQTKSEAQAIKEILCANGVDEARILLEDRSTTTLENFVNAKALLADAGVPLNNLAFLSSEFHLLRAGKIANLAGLHAASLPAPSPKERRFKNYLREAVVFPLLLAELSKVKKGV